MFIIRKKKQNQLDLLISIKKLQEENLNILRQMYGYIKNTIENFTMLLDKKQIGDKPESFIDRIIKRNPHLKVHKIPKEEWERMNKEFSKNLGIALKEIKNYHQESENNLKKIIIG